MGCMLVVDVYMRAQCSRYRTYACHDGESMPERNEKCLTPSFARCSKRRGNVVQGKKVKGKSGRIQGNDLLSCGSCHESKSSE